MQAIINNGFLNYQKFLNPFLLSDTKKLSSVKKVIRVVETDEESVENSKEIVSHILNKIIPELYEKKSDNITELKTELQLHKDNLDGLSNFISSIGSYEIDDEDNNVNVLVSNIKEAIDLLKHVVGYYNYGINTIEAIKEVESGNYWTLDQIKEAIAKK
jgi:hypothetical protein